MLICEGCTHHRQCGDIGTVKLPALIRRHTGLTGKEDLSFSFTSGDGVPGGSVRLSGNHPLRRLHAERAGNEIPDGLRKGHRRPP